MSSSGRRKILDEVRDTMRRLRYSIHTERAYCDWIRQYIRYHGMTTGKDLEAGVRLLSAEERTTQLLFGSAEGVVVFLNGQTLYAGYDLKDRPAWRVKADEHRVELPLKKGRNELVFAVSSQRFGWLSSVACQISAVW